MGSAITLLVVIGDAVPAAADLTSKTALPSSIRGGSFLGNVIGIDGVAPYTFAVQSGSLPAGLSLDSSTGVISGTPTTQGYEELTIRTTDNNGDTFDEVISIETGGGFQWKTPQQLPTAEHGIAFAMTFEVDGGTAPYTFSIVSGSPGGSLTLSGAGAGDYTRASPNAPSVTLVNSFTLRATDTNGNFVDKNFVEFTIPPITILSSAYPDGLVALPYSAPRAYTNGVLQPYPSIQPAAQWSISSGSLPPGTSLGPLTGTISGTPESAGFYSWDITVTDELGGSDTLSASIYVHAVSDIDKIYIGTFGDSFANVFVINHALQIAGLVPRSVFVYDVSVGPPHPHVDVEWEAVDMDNIQITTASIPGPGQYMVVVVG